MTGLWVYYAAFVNHTRGKCRRSSIREPNVIWSYTKVAYSVHTYTEFTQLYCALLIHCSRAVTIELKKTLSSNIYIEAMVILHSRDCNIRTWKKMCHPTVTSTPWWFKVTGAAPIQLYKIVPLNIHGDAMVNLHGQNCKIGT